MSDKTHVDHSKTVHLSVPTSDQITREANAPLSLLIQHQPLNHQQILHLQRTLGNQRVLQLIRNHSSTRPIQNRNPNAVLQRALKWKAADVEMDKRNVGGSFESFRNMVAGLRRYQSAMNDWGIDNPKLIPILQETKSWGEIQVKHYPTEKRNELVQEVIQDIGQEINRLTELQSTTIPGLKQLRGLSEMGGSRGTSKFASLIPSELIPNLVSTLQKMGIKDPSANMDKTGTIPMSLSHTYTLDKQSTDKIRLVRFVKAATVTGQAFSSEKPCDATIEGYVTYKPSSIMISKTNLARAKNTPTNQPARQAVVSALANTLNNAAKWSYDGPHKENISDNLQQLKNLDTPGLALKHIPIAADFPYLIATQFILVAYDEDRGEIVDIQQYEQTLAKWNANERKVADKPDESLI